MDRLDRFKTGPLFSHADPPTSAEAAGRVVASGAAAANRARVLALVRAHPGSTAVELHAAQGDGEGALERHEISRRLSDLAHAGSVRQGEPRECRIKGTKMVVWWAN